MSSRPDRPDPYAPALPEPSARGTGAWRPFLAVVVVYGAVALQQIALPGVYMDAVNPDYMAVRLLNVHAEPITAWLLPGNYLYDKAPILISFYHGSQQLWLGLPFFWLFGTTVEGLRITHALFARRIGIAVRVACARRGEAVAGGARRAALAIHPGFSYAFRTQSYITLAPAAWLFLALCCAQRGARAPARWGRWLFAGGVLYGFAIVGYFIYAFFLPAMLLALRWWRPDGARPRHTWLLPAAGVALGGIFYPVGYGLLAPIGRRARALGLFPADAEGAECILRAARPRHQAGTSPRRSAPSTRTGFTTR